MDFKIDRVFGIPLVCTLIEEDTSELLEHNYTNEFNSSSNQFINNPNWYDTYKFSNRALEKYPKTKQILLNVFKEFAHDSLGMDHELDISTSWFTKMDKGDYCAMHKHRNCFWSGVYYYDDEYLDEDQGYLEFADPVWNIGDFYIKYNRKNKLNLMNCYFKPESKMLILFPSFIDHGVTEYKGNGVRHSLALNFVPTSEYGHGDSTNNFSWYVN